MFLSTAILTTGRNNLPEAFLQKESFSRWLFFGAAPQTDQNFHEPGVLFHTWRCVTESIAGNDGN
ncbi:MAG: hypothetical protein V2I35_04865 [Desulfocapsaceae bacterium]|jgi:hypothetical protein|nr:hypothetical protein [Desulfocapsaceae bacterium]